jgi:hypothetical protein
MDLAAAVGLRELTLHCFDLASLGELLPFCVKLQLIVLRWCRLSEEAAVAFAAALPLCPSLTACKIRAHEPPFLHEDTALAFARSLPKCTNLKTFSLDLGKELSAACKEIMMNAQQTFPPGMSFRLK